MGRPRLFTDEQVLEIKANERGLSISEWADEYDVSYRTIQKVVLGLTYEEIGGRLGPNWQTLLDRQKPGPKVMRPDTPRTRTPVPSNLRGKEAEIRRMYDGMLDRLTQHFGCKRIELLRALSLTGPNGDRLGRSAKFNAEEVRMIREQYRQNMSYAQIGKQWGVSRTTIARILGRGQYTEDSYTPRSDTSEVIDDE